MKTIAFLLLVMLCVAPEEAIALTVRWIEQASISIDGDLSDWEGLPVSEIPISNVVPRYHAPSGPGDLSVSFEVLADKENVYVAFRVRDDQLTFGKEGFSTTWRQDCVEIYFDGDLVDVQKDTYDANDGQIRISSEDGHEAIMEGVVMVGDTPTQLPLLWEALGVVSAMEYTPDGYTVEVQIPAKVVGRAYLRPGDRMGLNVRVIDVDRDYVLKVVSWQPDVHSNSWINTRSIVPVQFLDDVLPRKDRPASVVLEGTHPAHIRMTIGGSEDSPMRRALVDLAQGDVVSAEPALEEVLRTSTDPKAQAWASHALGRSKMKRGEYTLDVSNLDLAREHFEVCASIDPENPDAYLSIGDILRVQGRYSEAAESYETALNASALASVHRAHAVLGLAHTYASYGNKHRAIEVIETNVDKLPDHAKLHALRFLSSLNKNSR